MVAGATGLIGIQLVKSLLENPNYGKVIALTRSKLPLEHTKLIQVLTNYEDLEPAIQQDLAGSDLFCALGTTIKKAKSKEQFRKVDFEYPMKLGRLALAYQAANFLIVSSMGADAKSRIFYTQVKGQVEEGLEQLKLPALHIFHPSLLLGDRQEARMGERIGSALSIVVSPLMVGGLRKYKPIQAEVVAKGMIEAAKLGNKGIHRYEYEQIAELANR
ncbi:NAD-dependent epimerase/dehydratase family protein [Paenibacillus agricola]|uniref:NAD-dependent epimerase/dehydratase family protein n=1 Tax=Paenibacillus agricola TaxID=2716264 RepID=UPI0028936D67|nr:NAD-dependent epimerase/dehydratase family protein [Paenibacillus agricola]